MSRINNLQMSLMGNFINIKLKNDIVIRLLTALQSEEFIPGSAEIASVDVTTGKVTVDSRMQLVSPDKTWNIVFLDDRINFDYNYQEGTTEYKKLLPIVDYGKILISKVFGVFSDTTGNRLALNGRFVLDGLSDEDLRIFCSKYTKPLNTFSDDVYAEWAVRFNSRKKFNVDGMEEIANRIVEMSQLERSITNQKDGEETVIHDIIVSFDVNTARVPSENRFNYLNLLSFISEAAEFVETISKEVQE